MAGAGTGSELLVSLSAADLLAFRVGRPWISPGCPGRVTQAIPDDPVLSGLVVFAQGALLDANSPSGVPIGLTHALTFRVLP